MHINFDTDMQVIVLGTMQLQGQGAQHIVLQAPAVFPPIIDIDGGVFNAGVLRFHRPGARGKRWQTWRSLTVRFQ